MAQALARFVSPSLLGQLDRAGWGRKLPPPRRQELTVLFVDIAGSTPFAEDNEPEVVAEFLAEFYEIAMTQLFARQGTLDAFAGDGMLAYFGTGDGGCPKETAAVETAIGIRAGFDELSRRRAQRGGDVLAIRCGITTGYVTIGTFGGDRFASYSVIGHHVNVAARIQAHAAPGKILTDKATAARLHDGFEKLALEPVALKGITKPVEVYCIDRISRSRDGSSGRT